MSQRFGVMGGGSAGCAAAFELRQQGHEVVLFEQAAALGGRTHRYAQAIPVHAVGRFLLAAQCLATQCGPVVLAATTSARPRWKAR